MFPEEITVISPAPCPLVDMDPAERLPERVSNRTLLFVLILPALIEPAVIVIGPSAFAEDEVRSVTVTKPLFAVISI